MLKSTYKAPDPAHVDSSLPEGWTEHIAPAGHKYYYNASTKQSTYTRPTIQGDETLQIDFNATQPDHELRARETSLPVTQEGNPILQVAAATKTILVEEGMEETGLSPKLPYRTVSRGCW